MENVRSQPAVLSALRTKNAIASAVIVVVACAIYLLSPYNHASLARLYGTPQFGFTGYRFMVVTAAVYLVFLTMYFLRARAPAISKSLRFFQVAARFARQPVATVKAGLEREDKLAVLTTLVKSFFAPMMVKSLMIFSMSAWANGQRMLDLGLAGGGALLMFDRFGYWFLMQVILFVDTFFFTVGYLVESRRLGNEIRSVDPTLIGWAAALLCYQPFNAVSAHLLGTVRSDFPQFEDPTVHVALNLLLLTLMAIYASASVALGLKASNLTHRGIVARGPYAWVRHPAYVCKNLAWWIGSVPVVAAAFQVSMIQGLAAAGSVLAWSGLYVLRALTEEDHLRSVDGDYDAYAARVRYRFIPGLV